MATTSVLLAVELFPELEDILDKRFNVVRLWKQPDQSKFQQIRAVIVDPRVRVNTDFLRSFPALEIVSTLSVGLDKVDLDACRERGIVVTNTPDVVTEDTADTAMALVLATMRMVCAADKYVRQGLWPVQGHFPLSHKVSGKHVGIVGLGRIGTAIAKRAQAFNCKISYYSRSDKSVPFTRYENLVELARDSDVLIVSCALTEETFHLINREVMEALSSKGTLINIARGSVVDEVEMVSALKQGKLGAAGLDVFEKEPNVPVELLGLDNVVLLPHVGTSTWETAQEMVELAADNVEAHLSGKPLLTPVKHL